MPPFDLFKMAFWPFIHFLLKVEMCKTPSFFSASRLICLSMVGIFLQTPSSYFQSLTSSSSHKAVVIWCVCVFQQSVCQMGKLLLALREATLVPDFNCRMHFSLLVFIFMSKDESPIRVSKKRCHPRSSQSSSKWPWMHNSEYHYTFIVSLLYQPQISWFSGPCLDLFRIRFLSYYLDYLPTAWTQFGRPLGVISPLSP